MEIVKRFTLSIILFVLCASGILRAADAEEKRALTLPEAVALATERHPQILSAQARIEALKGRIREVRSDALPDVTLNSSGMRWRDPSFLNSPSFDQLAAEFPGALIVKSANLFDYHIGVSQPLYTAGKVGTAIKLASLESEGVGVDRARVEQEIKLSVIRSFNELLLAAKQLDVAHDTVAQRELHLEMARSRYKLGVATEVDVLRSEVSLANAKPELIRAENSVRHARAVLNNLLVRPIDFPTEAAGELSYTPSTQGPLAEVIRSALNRRPEMERARINLLETAGQIKLAHAENKLRVDLNAQYGYSARQTTNLWDQNFTRWMFTINVSLPLFDGGRRSGMVQQAIANRRIVEQARVETEENVRLEVQTALDELERADKTVEAARLNVQQAERVLTMMQDNYRYGAATTLDVTDAQTALTTARWTLLQGLYDHTMARVQLRYVMGLDPLEKVDATSQSSN